MWGRTAAIGAPPGPPAAAAPAAGRGGLAAAALAAVTVAALVVLAPPAVSAPLMALAVAALLAARARLIHERAAMRALSQVDALTGLGNRRLLRERIAYEAARHRRSGHRFALLVLDLDGFKAVNDRYGHPAGDEVLCDVAAALRRTVRAQDSVVRLGGDEFCVLAPETGPAEAACLAGRLAAAVAEATAGLEGLGASAGWALFPDDGADAATLLARADAAEGEAKRRSRAARDRPARAA